MWDSMIELDHLFREISSITMKWPWSHAMSPAEYLLFNTINRGHQSSLCTWSWPRKIHSQSGKGLDTPICLECQHSVDRLQIGSVIRLIFLLPFLQQFACNSVHSYNCLKAPFPISHCTFLRLLKQECHFAWTHKQRIPISLLELTC